MKALVAAASVVILAAAAAIIVLLDRHTAGGPDAFAGAYPMVTPAPTASPSPTWRPAAIPAGPLPVFPGAGSRMTGRIVDRHAGVSYARFGAPWHQLTTQLAADHTSGEEIDSKIKDFKHFWYVAVYVGPLDSQYDVRGAQRLRAGAELVGQAFVRELYSGSGGRQEIAGAPLTIDRRPAWVTAFRMTHPASEGERVAKAQTEVVVALDTGRAQPTIIEMTVPSNQNSRLPDVNHLIRSLHIVR